MAHGRQRHQSWLGHLWEYSAFSCTIFAAALGAALGAALSPAISPSAFSCTIFATALGAAAPSIPTTAWTVL